MSGVSREMIDGLLAASTFSVSKVSAKTCMMVCTLPCGFEITEASACVNPADYDEAVGAGICRKKIEDKLWELEGYRKQFADWGASLDGTLSFQDRVRVEHNALFEKVGKLGAFLGCETFCALPDAEQGRLTRQFDAMGQYLSILEERIAAFG